MKFFTLSANWGEQLWLFLQNNGPKFLLAIVVLIVGLALTKAAEKPMRRILQKSKIDASAHKLILQIVNIALKVVVLLITAETLGIKTTSLIALFSAVGLAISLAVKDFLSNMTGGFLVLITHPFTKGDFIETNSVSGMVENITLFYTTLKTPDNKKIFIPNGEICTAKIINYSAEETRRLDMVFSISYNDDLSAAKQILADLGRVLGPCLRRSRSGLRGHRTCRQLYQHWGAGMGKIRRLLDLEFLYERAGKARL